MTTWPIPAELHLMEIKILDTMGEPGVAVMALAIASDIFAAAGKRIRDLLIKHTKLV